MAQKRTGSQIIIELLKQNGIKTVSGIPGGSILPLYDELARSGIRHILVRHEQAAGFIAQGMARVSGKAGVCFATSGPGAMNLLTAIADARSDSIPLVAITGQVNLNLVGTDAFQEADTFGLSFPITKHSMLVKSASELIRAIPLAFAIAESGRPGPVLIDVPRNVQLELSDIPDDFSTCFKTVYDEYVKSGKGVRFRTTGEEAIALSHKFATALLSSKRPVLYLGGGSNNPCAEEKIREFLEIFDCPVVSSLMALGVVPVDSPAFLGMVGMHGSLCANRAMHDADLVLAAGARFDDRATGVVEQFCPNAKILHIDIDAAEVNKIINATEAIIDDCALSFSKIISEMKKLSVDENLVFARTQWFKKCQEEKKIEKNESGAKEKSSFQNPLDFIRSIPEIAEKSGKNADDIIVSTDVGQHQMWTAQGYRFTHTRQFLTSGSLGTMGFGLPAAIGAALSLPKKRIVCFSGDGSIMMNIQELATLSELGVDVTVIVLDNGCLGMVRQQQEFLFDKNYSASTFSKRLDFVKIAEGFGIRAFDATTDESWKKEAFSGSGPRFVCVKIDGGENVLPFVKAGQANIDAIR